MDSVGVRVEVPANTPVVLLREREGRQRLLPILIGSPEASAIHTALEGIQAPRPLTHDLAVHVIERLGASISEVVITEIRDHVFFAELHLAVLDQGAAAPPISISCRPSDAIALAVRVGCPIMATETLLHEAGQEPVAEPAAEEEAIIDEFRDFLDALNPDDFQG